MTRPSSVRYARTVLKPTLAGAGRILAILSVILLGTAAASRADTTTLDGTEAPLVRIDVETGNVTVKTWDRPVVAVEAVPNDVQIDRQHFSVPVSTVPILAGRVQGPDGLVTLPEETFAVSTLGPEDRDVVRITGHDVTSPITVTIPNSTALLVVQATAGAVVIRHYTGGTFVARVQRGRIRLDHDGGSGFVQIMRGPVVANDSNFDRFRSRTALGVTLFERCRARQIQATSVAGPIIYDHGSFDPGLARFQSETGAVAIGVDGPAQLGAHGGHVYTSFGQHVDFQNRSDESATATIGGGGPEVTAASTTGSVYLYDGSLRDKALGGQWNQVNDVIQRIPAAETEPRHEPVATDRYVPPQPRPIPQTFPGRRRLQRVAPAYRPAVYRPAAVRYRAFAATRKLR